MIDLETRRIVKQQGCVVVVVPALYMRQFPNGLDALHFFMNDARELRAYPVEKKPAPVLASVSYSTHVMEEMPDGTIDGREVYTKQEWEAKRARILATPLPGEKPAPIALALSGGQPAFLEASMADDGKAGAFHFIDGACDDLKKHDDQLGYCINNCAFVTPAECHECLKDNADLYQAEQLESIDEPEEK